MTTSPLPGDVRRRAGWLPSDQDAPEGWLAGHRSRVESRGEQIVLQPVLAEFQELIDSDPVVRLYVNEMIEQAPRTKPYHRWHSPVGGTIVRAFVCEGTYSSEPDSEGADAVEPQNSQSHLPHELGYFQFGGSTHCLVLRPGVIADFSLQALPRPHDPRPPLLPVRSRLATAN